MPASKNAADYHLRVTAGPSYDPSTHRLIHVNTSKPVTIKSEHIDAKVNVRIQNYRGLPSNSPSTSPYFSHPPHTHDLYSISFSFSIPEDIPGTDILFGNDFRDPIRDKLPPGFGAAFRIVKWAIDPGLTGDVYADEPWLYGPLLSSINTFRVGEKDEMGSASSWKDEGIEEGGDGSGLEVRKRHGLPDAGATRMKRFLNEGKRKDWIFEKGRVYSCDFFNPYLDFNELSLKLPGASLKLMGFWDGQPLRYVVKHKTADGSTDSPLMVVVFSLLTTEELEKEAEQHKASGEEDEEHNTAARENKGTETAIQETAETSADETKYVDEGVD